MERYIHGLFPIWGIRFVSIVDNADTANKGNKKSRQINGLVNEWYLEDMSDSIKSALDSRRRNGFHIGSFALYGYKKDPDLKGHLIIDEEAAADLFEEIVGFANYAFNKSHAAAYGVLSYRTAYLKAHYPREYNSALLTSVLGSADKMAEYIAECTRVGIKILPPHVNESDRDFHVDGKNIRFGLLALKNLGRPFVESLIAERKRGGKFASFDDFIYRMGDSIGNKRQLEMLIKSGALDGLGAHRSQLLIVYETVLDARSAANRQSVAGQLDKIRKELVQNNNRIV